ncbi:MAG: hypothetical protein IJ853_02510 [Rickettsiales bacterium]|nr:hypothetical protein [Rickettsiales bacterium]
MRNSKINYSDLIDKALRYTVKLALKKAEKMKGENFCFFLVVNTEAEGVVLPNYVKKEYPEQITLILQHQFSNLSVKNNGFSVDLSFGGKIENVVIPFDSLIVFSDETAGIRLNFNYASKDLEGVCLVDEGEIEDLYSYLFSDEEANVNVDLNNNLINFNDLKKRR